MAASDQRGFCQLCAIQRLVPHQPSGALEISSPSGSSGLDAVPDRCCTDDCTCPEPHGCCTCRACTLQALAVNQEATIVTFLGRVLSGVSARCSGLCALRGWSAGLAVESSLSSLATSRLFLDRNNVAGVDSSRFQKAPSRMAATKQADHGRTWFRMNSILSASAASSSSIPVLKRFQQRVHAPSETFS